jgi:hypothetical protein
MEEYRIFDERYDDYEVSNYGNVRKRCVDAFKYMSGNINPTTGYKRVCISNNKTFYIHVIVAKVFIGERPDRHVIDHIDRNKLNNHISNLRYASYKQNKQNSDTFKGYIREKTLKEGRIRFVADIRTKEGRFKKTFDTREEAESWVENGDYSDAPKRGKQGDGCISETTYANGTPRFRAMTRHKGVLHTKTFTSKEEAQEWIYNKRSELYL